MAHELSPDQIARISDAVFSGRKIQATRLYRKFTGVELKEAKDFIDALTVQLRTEHPDRFASADKGTGCLVLFAALAGTFLLQWWRS